MTRPADLATVLHALADQVETRTKSPREGRAGGRPHERLTEDRAGRLPP